MAFRLASAVHVLRKEVREGLRDRSLVISVILVPAFLYPILGFAGYEIAQIIRGISQQRTTTIAIGSAVPASIAANLSGRERIDVIEAPVALDAVSFPDAARYRSHRDVDDAARLDALLLWNTGPPASAALYFDESRDRSRSAADEVREAVHDWQRSEAIVALTELGLGEGDFDLWDIERENTASGEETGRKILSVVLPMFLLLMLSTGTFYSTLDAVVGERERGTLETILVAPVGRAEILVGKFAFVVLASITALLLNLVSLTVFVGFVLDLLGTEELTLSIGPAAFGLILITALLTACVISAVFMVVSIPMKTYREGQAALTPAYFLTMIPGFMVAISKETFEMKHALVPFINTVALFKSVLLGDFPLVPILVTLGVLAALTVATLAYASRIVAKEEIYVEPKTSLRALITGKQGGRA